MEGVDDVGGDPAARRHLVTIATGPLADRRALLAVDGGTATSGGTRAAAAAPTDAPAGLDPRLEIVTKFLSILCGKIDLIAHAIEREFNRFVCCARTVEIVE